MAEKPSFAFSMLSGVKGWVKGLLAGGLTGLVVGGVVGAAAGLLTGGVGAIVGGMITGGYTGGSILGSIGALAGMATEVVRSREVSQPSANDIVNVAKVSYAQGIAAGHAIAQDQQAGQSTQWQDKETQRRAAAAQQSPTLH